MTSNTEDGGAAFPCDPDTHWDYTGEPNREAMGMSLRDWFAGQWLQGWGDVAVGYEHAAKEAYRAADAMLAQRKAPSDG